jgi:DNA repair protein RecO (recombination protein O)
MLPSMQFLEDTGIVLRSQPYQERDRLVTILTENNGKISGVAKGAIHSKRFGGAFDLFTCIRFKAKDSVSQGLVRFDEAVIRRDFHSLRTRLENMSAAGYFVDLTLRLSEERQNSRELFLLLTHYLYLLEEATASHEIVRSFEIKLLDRLGYGPDLNECMSCRASIVDAQKLGTAVERGGFLCAECTPNGSRTLEGQTLKWFRAAREILVQNTPLLRFSQEVTANGARILMLFLRYHCPGLEKYEFRSHAMLEQFLIEGANNRN